MATATPAVSSASSRSRTVGSGAFRFDLGITRKPDSCGCIAVTFESSDNETAASSWKIASVFCSDMPFGDDIALVGMVEVGILDDRIIEEGTISEDMIEVARIDAWSCGPGWSPPSLSLSWRLATCSEPNRPWNGSPPGAKCEVRPAVKYSVFVGPAAPPLPNASAHRCVMAIGWRLASFSSPAKRPLCGLKALMWPSPKLPTRRSLLKLPKSEGASAMAHG